ncbi:MAG: FGGY-family carbohydrate kinase [Anaerolineae bacterium]|nr:FGGY-family carbohydrate kinase [Anaerolineae bacterium]
MRDLLLGIDVGTSAAKAVAISLDGHTQGVGQAEYLLHSPRPDHVEQNPEDWWTAVCVAIRRALDGVPSAADRIAGVAVSSQAPTLLPLDREGRPLRPALIWMDRRADAEVDLLKRELGADRLFEITGNRVDSYYVAAKLLWFSRHEPELLARTHQFVQVNGYIVYRLSGDYSLDNGHAGLLSLRDYRRDAWSDELMARCGLEPRQFPPVQPGHHILGEVTPAAADVTGLRPGTPVLVGTVDASAAALETGVIEGGTAAEMTGTSTVLIMSNAGAVTHPALIAFPHVLTGLNLLVGATVASGASLKWFRDQLGQLEVQAAGDQGRSAFDLLTAQAEAIAPGSGGVVFLPYMMGERSPLWLTEARGVFFGLSLTTPRAALIRAILEGTSFSLRHNVETARSAGLELKEIRSVGGGARSLLWCQIKADILGIPIAVPETSTGAPYGDALLVGLGTGLYPDLTAIIRSVVRIQRTFEPDPSRHERYSEIYGVYRDLGEHLVADFKNAASVFGADRDGDVGAND